MKHLLATSISIALLSLGLTGCSEKQAAEEVTSDAFVTIQGQDLIKPDGTKLFIMGTNLGNWLNPKDTCSSSTRPIPAVSSMRCSASWWDRTLRPTSGKHSRTIM